MESGRVDRVLALLMDEQGNRSRPVSWLRHSFAALQCLLSLQDCCIDAITSAVNVLVISTLGGLSLSPRLTLTLTLNLNLNGPAVYVPFVVSRSDPCLRG